jgi:hypothetical protein
MMTEAGERTEAPPSWEIAPEVTPEERQFECPECRAAGETRVFGNAQGLAAHRRQAHGVRVAARRRKRVVGARGKSVSAELDKDRLVRALFPSGMPAKADLVQRVGAWLSEAEELHRTR